MLLGCFNCHTSTDGMSSTLEVMSFRSSQGSQAQCQVQSMPLVGLAFTQHLIGVKGYLRAELS